MIWSQLAAYMVKKIESLLLCPVRVCEPFCRMCSKVKRNPDAGCEESRFYSLPFGQVVASMYWPKSLLSSPKKIFDKQHWLQIFCNLNFSKYFIFPSGKLNTWFTSPIAKPVSPELSDTTFFARCPDAISYQGTKNSFCTAQSFVIVALEKNIICYTGYVAIRVSLW